ncbi:MAG: hypothetical protein OCD76_07325 [Reichenbachiella sp.]
MAQGDFTLFEEYSLYIADGSHDMNSDTFALILITTLPTASDATPDRADYTEVTNGGGYTTGGISLTTSYTEAAGTATFDSTTNPSWTASAGSPTDIKGGLLVNNTHAGTNDAVGFIDMTTDGGTTAISLVAGDITVTWNASGVFTLA